MELIRFENTSKVFGSTKVVSEINLEINQGETVVLLGPSGSGKTTILKLINGLEEATEGEIFYKGKQTGHILPYRLRRSMGYVIQNAGLFPHLTVKENITIPVRITGNKPDPILVPRLLDLVGMTNDLGDRYPHELSGGQQQRVGLARALANEPELILMDEPFSALDNITRKQLQDDFLELDYLTGKTIIMVTHDIFEAFKLGDRIVILDHGKIQQTGTPLDLLFRPENPFVKEFLKNDQFVLKLQNLTSEKIGIEGNETLFQILEGTKATSRQKLDVMRKFIDFETGHTHD